MGSMSASQICIASAVKRNSRSESGPIISAENVVEDHLSGDEFTGVGDRCIRVAGSAGDSGKYPAELADAQRSAKSKTA